MNKDTLTITPTAGNINTESNMADITIEVHLNAEYADIEEFLKICCSGKKTRLSHLTKLIQKRIK